MQRLSDSRSSLASLVESQKASLLDFQARISSVVADFTISQTQQLVAALAEVDNQQQAVENRIRAREADHQQTTTKAIKNGVSLSSRLDTLESRVAEMRQSGSQASPDPLPPARVLVLTMPFASSQAIATTSDKFKSGLSSISNVAIASLDIELQDLEQHFVQMAEASEKCEFASLG